MKYFKFKLYNSLWFFLFVIAGSFAAEAPVRILSYNAMGQVDQIQVAQKKGAKLDVKLPTMLMQWLEPIRPSLDSGKSELYQFVRGKNPLAQFLKTQNLHPISLHWLKTNNKKYVGINRLLWKPHKEGVQGPLDTNIQTLEGREPLVLARRFDSLGIPHTLFMPVIAGGLDASPWQKAYLNRWIQAVQSLDTNSWFQITLIRHSSGLVDWDQSLFRNYFDPIQDAFFGDRSGRVDESIYEEDRSPVIEWKNQGLWNHYDGLGVYISLD